MRKNRIGKYALSLALSAACIVPTNALAEGENSDELNLSSPEVQAEYQQATIDTETAIQDDTINQEELTEADQIAQQIAPEKYSLMMKERDPQYPPPRDNAISFSLNTTATVGKMGTVGDILVTYLPAHFGWNHGHAAIVRYDNNYIVEAWTGNDNKVRNYQNNFGKRFSDARKFYVKGATDQEYKNAAAYETEQVGDPYSLAATTNTTTKFYCSQLVWQAWSRQGYDLDGNGGFVVTPANLEADSQTIRY
jgi:uncharacterized protein YycO